MASRALQTKSGLGLVERRRIPLSSVRETGSRQSKLWILVVISVLTIPFENEYALGGFSVAKLTIIPLFFAVIVLQPRALVSMSRQRVFLCALAFVAWGAVSEFFRPLSDWEFIFRVFQTVVFAALVGAVAANALAYRRILSSIACVCSVLAVYLILAFYGGVSADVASSKEAGHLREAALSQMGLATGLNILGYTVGMGAVVALAKFFGSKSTKLRIVWSAIFILCAVGSFVPLSRGSFLALIGASLFVVLRNRRALWKPGTLVILIFIALLAFSFTPRALTERYASLGSEAQLEESSTGKVEGRTRIFRASINNFPEYWEIGVGSGYYWKSWGRRNGFGGFGPHNGFLTAWIFYGLPGFLLLSLTCCVAALACPKPKKSSPETAALGGLLVLALFWLMFTHNLYLKSFGVILGLLMSAEYRQALHSSRVMAIVTSTRPARPRLKHGVRAHLKRRAGLGGLLLGGGSDGI